MTTPAFAEIHSPGISPVRFTNGPPQRVLDVGTAITWTWFGIRQYAHTSTFQC